MFLFNGSFGNVNIFLIWMKCWHLRNVHKAQIQGAGSSGGQAGLELSLWKHAVNSVRMLLPHPPINLFFYKVKHIQFLPPTFTSFFIKWNRFIGTSLKKEDEIDWASIFWLSRSRSSCAFICCLLAFSLYVQESWGTSKKGMQWCAARHSTHLVP